MTQLKCKLIPVAAAAVSCRFLAVVLETCQDYLEIEGQKLLV